MSKLRFVFDRLVDLEGKVIRILTPILGAGVVFQYLYITDKLLLTVLRKLKG